MAGEEFWLIYSLDFASLVEWQEGWMGFDVWTQKDLAKGKIVLEFALKKNPKIFSKVRIFWESHKILRNLHLTFVYSTNSKVKISKNLVAFSEYLNFDWFKIQ